jgi:Tol biopolymer transport system component
MQYRHLPVGVVCLFLLLLSRPFAAPEFSPWSEPVSLGPAINSPFNDTAPTLSKDGLRLYFTSTRPCGQDDTILDFNVWVARRDAEGASWESPRCLGMNVDGFEDSAPAFSRDGHWMFFVSDRPGSQGTAGFNGRDLWVSWRAHVHDDNGWEEPFNAGASINSAFADAGPTYFENEHGAAAQLFFTSNRNGTFDIWVSDAFGNGLFGAPRRVDEVSTGVVEARPFIRHDGLELFFFRQSTLPSDIYSTTRPDPGAPWTEPVNLGPIVNGPANDAQAAIGSDRTTLVFASDRGNAVGSFDLWMTTRTKGRQP